MACAIWGGRGVQGGAAEKGRWTCPLWLRLALAACGLEQILSTVLRAGVRLRASLVFYWTPKGRRGGIVCRLFGQVPTDNLFCTVMTFRGF